MGLLSSRGVDCASLALTAAAAAGFAATAGADSPLLATPATASGIAPVAAATEALSAQAGRLLSEAKPIAARATLTRTLRSTAADQLSASEREQCVALLEQSERRIRQLDAAELSLQKAELAAADGDLLIAERHAQGAAKLTALSQSQKLRAEGTLKEISSRRAELAPTVSTSVSTAIADFNAGRFDQAKTALSSLYRSGVELTAEQRRTVDTYQIKLVDMERAAGTPFATSDASLVAMQPGKVRKADPSDWPGPTSPKNQPAEPAPAPAREPGSEPAPATQPAPAEPMGEPSPEMFPVPAPVNAPPAPAPAGQPVPPLTPEAAPAPTPAPAPAPAPMSGGVAEPVMAPSTPSAAPSNDSDLIAMAMRADAERMLAEADQAFADSRFSDALRGYEQVLATSRSTLSAEQIKKAEDRANDCRVRLKQGGDISGSLIADVKLARERATAEFNNALAQARGALATGEIEKARTNAAEARLITGRNKQYFSQAENDDMAKKAADLGREVDAAADKSAKDRQNKEATDRETRAGKARTDAAAQKATRISERIDRVRALQREQRYPEAVQVCDEILFLDSGNPTALLLKDIISDVIVYQSFERSQVRKAKGVVTMEAENLDAAIPPKGIVVYPTDWPAKSLLRGEGGGGGETPENARAMAMLENRKIPVAEFKGNHLSDVVAFIEQATGANFDVQWESLRQIGIEPSTRVSLKLQDVPAKVVLERVLRKVSKDSHATAEYSVDQGIVTIASADDIKRQVTTTTYNITDLLIEPTNATDIPTVDLQQVYANLNMRANRTDPFSAKVADGREQGLTPRHDRVRKITDLIQTTISPETWRDNGGDVGSLSELSGTLIVKQTPKNHKEIQGLLSKLREIRSMQISVESRFLLVDQGFFEQIGFDLDVYFNARSNQVQSATAGDPSILPSDFFNFTNSTSQNRVLRGQGSTAAVPTAGFDATVQRQSTINPDRWSPVGASQNSLGIAQSLAGANNFASRLLAQAPALGIAGTFLDDVQVDFLVKATQADNRALSLTAPRLTFTNGQTANVYVATQRAIISDLTPVTSESAVAFDPQPTTIVANGVTLLVEGVISADRRYVTMNIETSISTLLNVRTLSVNAAVGGTLAASSSFGSFIELPEVQVTRVQTTVTVPDEGTVLLGGQRLVTEIESESGVPLLSKIPIVNRFFTNRVEAKTESTLLILVKPTVLLQSEQEEKEFPGLNDRLRSGGL